MDMKAQAQPQPQGQPQANVGAQEGLRRTLAAAMKALYRPEVSKAVLAIVSKGEDKAKAVFAAAVMILEQLEKQGGKKELLMLAVGPLCALVAELAAKAGLIGSEKEVMPQIAKMLGEYVKGKQAEMQPKGLVGQAMPPQAPAQPQPQPAAQGA